MLLLFTEFFRSRNWGLDSVRKVSKFKCGKVKKSPDNMSPAEAMFFTIVLSYSQFNTIQRDQSQIPRENGIRKSGYAVKFGYQVFDERDFGLNYRTVKIGHTH